MSKLRGVSTRTIRRRADKFEQDNDGLSLRQQVRECCDEIDRLKRKILQMTEELVKKTKASSSPSNWTLP